MMLSGWQSDDLPHANAAIIPLSHGLCSQNMRAPKDTERHDDAKIVHADVHPPVDDDIIGNVADKRWQTNWHNAHTSPEIERGHDGRRSGKRKPFNAVNDNSPQWGDAA